MNQRWWAFLLVFLLIIVQESPLLGDKKPPAPRITEKPGPQSCACKDTQLAIEQSRPNLTSCLYNLTLEARRGYAEQHLELFYEQCVSRHMKLIEAAIRCQGKCLGPKACLLAGEDQKKDLNQTLDATIRENFGYPLREEMKRFTGSRIDNTARSCLLKRNDRN